MENKLKPATSQVISTLNDCNVRQIMATGDNVLTAISVARQCNLIKPEKRIILGELHTEAGHTDSKLKWSSQ